MATPQHSLVRQEVVACVLTDGLRSCLVRRSELVRSDRGLWHCVTGYLDPGLSPRDAMVRELEEELGLDVGDIETLQQGRRLTYDAGDVVWVVHTFLAKTSRTDLELNWENDAYVWTEDPENRQDCVWWLREVYAVLRSGVRPCRK